MYSTSENRIIVVQGAQYGSEAKGTVAAALCQYYGVDYAIRTGTVNAGHTVIFDGKPYKMQQLPTGWAVERGRTPRMVIGAGAFIQPHILAQEIEQVNLALSTSVEADIRPHLYIDHRCGLHLAAHTALSASSGRHYSMGATGKGCSEAVMAKVRSRGTKSVESLLFKGWLEDMLTHFPEEVPPQLQNLTFCDTSKLLNDAWDAGAKLLLEGTQGTLLDLHLGPYPFTTHKQTQVGSWLAEAGLSANLPIEVCLVARTFPIRVAGNSGPLPDEISWCDLALEMNARLNQRGLPPIVHISAIMDFEGVCSQVAAQYWKGKNCPFAGEQESWQIERWSSELRAAHPEFVSELHRKALGLMPSAVVTQLEKLFEMTTVTHKLRRIARMNMEEMQRSIMLNRPDYIALTFANYLFPEVRDKDWDGMGEESREEIETYIEHLAPSLNCPINFISTGPATDRVLEVAI